MRDVASVGALLPLLGAIADGRVTHVVPRLVVAAVAAHVPFLSSVAGPYSVRFVAAALSSQAAPGKRRVSE
jgi:hypothetical protein